MYLNGLTVMPSSFQLCLPTMFLYLFNRQIGNGANSAGCITEMSNHSDSLWAIVITTLFDLRFGVGMLEAINNTFGLFGSFGIDDVVSWCDFS